MKHVFYLILQALFIHEIFKFLYFHLPLFFSLSAIALEVDPRKISKSDIINCTENIRKNLDEGNVVWGIFVDLQKAFDTVEHDIL